MVALNFNDNSIECGKYGSKYPSCSNEIKKGVFKMHKKADAAVKAGIFKKQEATAIKEALNHIIFPYIYPDTATYRTKILDYIV